jgi:uncharacterized membrane protein
VAPGESAVTEEQIERRAERAMDRLDRLFMSGQISQSEYDREVSSLNRWTENAHRERQKAR